VQNKFQEGIQIEFTPEFKRNLKQLAKKYRHIRTDLEPVIGELQKGNLIGDRVPSIGYPIFKVRVKNSDIQKGKRAGYRLVKATKRPNFIKEGSSSPRITTDYAQKSRDRG